MMLPKNSLSAIMHALVSACASFTEAILAKVEPSIAARLEAGARPYVVVRLDPASAAVFAEAPGGESSVVGGADAFELPAALAEAAASFVNLTIDELPAPMRGFVTQQVRAGTGKLAVLVEAFPGEASALLYLGADAPIVLKRITLAATVQ